MAGWENDSEEIYVEKVEEFVDTNPDLYKQRTIVALNERRYKDALKEAQLALKYGNQELQYHVLIVRVLLEMGQYDVCYKYLTGSGLWKSRKSKELLPDERNYLYYTYARCFKECGFDVGTAELIIVTDDVYNVYIKLADLNNKGITITPEILQEIQNIVRVERQNHPSAIKQLLPNGLVKDLVSVRALDGILKVMLDDMEAFWGKGTYYSSYEIKAKFDSNPEVQKMVPTLAAFTKKSLEDEYRLYTAEVRKVFEEYGIMPVGILKEDAAKYQIKELKGLYGMVTACYSVAKKRAYHVFPVGHWASDGRYKAGITVHKVNETRKLPLTIWGHTVEEYEEKVLQELMNVYATNVKYHCANNKSIPELMEKSADDILRFYQVVESKTVKAKVREYIKKMNLKKNK